MDMKTMQDVYEEQFNIRKHNLTIESLNGIDGTNEHIYDAGFINGMRFMLLGNKDYAKFDCLTEEEIMSIIENREKA
jgi:hypothetical protein